MCCMHEPRTEEGLPVAATAGEVADVPHFLTYCSPMFHGGALGSMKAMPVGSLPSLMLWQLAFACVNV